MNITQCNIILIDVICGLKCLGKHYKGPVNFKILWINQQVATKLVVHQKYHFQRTCTKSKFSIIKRFIWDITCKSIFLKQENKTKFDTNLCTKCIHYCYLIIYMTCNGYICHIIGKALSKSIVDRFYPREQCMLLEKAISGLWCCGSHVDIWHSTNHTI